MNDEKDEARTMALVSDLIAYIANRGFETWNIVNQLCDLVLSSELCALQANLSLADQVRPSTSDHHLLRVARLWIIMLRSCGYAFVEYNFSPGTKFLEAVEQVIDSSPDSGAGARLLRVLGSAVYEHSQARGDHPYTVVWSRVKHPGQPITGLRIPDDDALLRPTGATPPLPPASRVARHYTPESNFSVKPLAASASRRGEAASNRGLASDLLAPNTRIETFDASKAQRTGRPTSTVDAPGKSNPSPSFLRRSISNRLPRAFLSPSPNGRPDDSGSLPVPSTPLDRSRSDGALPTTRRRASSDVGPGPGSGSGSERSVVAEGGRKRSFRRAMGSLRSRMLPNDPLSDHNPAELNERDQHLAAANERLALPSFPAASTSFPGHGLSSSSSRRGSTGIRPDSPILRLASSALPSSSDASHPSSNSNSTSSSNSSHPLSSTDSNSTSSSGGDIFAFVNAGLNAQVTLNMSIADLCEHIRASPSAANDSRLLSLVWNKEQSGVKHEFLLVKFVMTVDATPPSSALGPSPLPGSPGELGGGGGGGGGRRVTSWLRLDRAARKGYRGFLNFRSSSAIFPANDTAMLSNNKHALMSETSKVQLNIDFRLSPSLLDLERLLTVISEESSEYDLFKENCYFFCSVIQQLLTELYQGRIEYGKPLHGTLGADTRKRILLRLRQRIIPFRFEDEAW